MAVDKKPYDTKPYPGFKFSGVDVIEIVAQIVITNGDGINSIYRIGEVPSNAILVGGELTSEAITSLTDADLGIYETDEHGGAVLDIDAFIDGADLSSATVPGTGVNAMKSIGVLNIGKKLHELVSDGSAERAAYTIALTAKAAPGATKNAQVRLRFLKGA